MERSKPRKGDVTVTKNYLTKEELEALNLIVSLYRDFAELQALSRKTMSMSDWIAKLDDFLRLSERDILNHAGSVSHDDAIAKATAEYEKFRVEQAALQSRAERDFEDAVRKLPRKRGGK